MRTWLDAHARDVCFGVYYRLVQLPVAPVRPHNHDWYQSLTMGTIYSLVVGLRCEDPRLPSPRYVRALFWLFRIFFKKIREV